MSCLSTVACNFETTITIRAPKMYICWQTFQTVVGTLIKPVAAATASSQPRERAVNTASAWQLIIVTLGRTALAHIKAPAAIKSICLRFSRDATDCAALFLIPRELHYIAVMPYFPPNSFQFLRFAVRRTIALFVFFFFFLLSTTSHTIVLNLNCAATFNLAATGSRTITSDQIVYNNTEKY